MIIVSGCSWTDANFTTAFHPEMDCSWPKWFDHIDTDQQVLSIGYSGNSNWQIIDKALEQVYTQTGVTTVVCALTEWSRFSLFDHQIHPSLWMQHAEALAMAPEKRTSKERMILDNLGHLVKFYDSVVSLSNIPKTLFVSSIVNETIQKLKILQDVCQARGIKLVVFQMLHPIPWPFTAIAMKTLIKNKIFQEMYIDSSNDFLNFPFFPDLDGTNVEYLLMKKREDYHKYTISEHDLHPNELGHKLIGDWFNEQVKLP